MILGILLAAGQSTRFGSHKLLHPLPDGTPLAIAALRNLTQGVDQVAAVVRPDDHELAHLLVAEGAQLVYCAEAGKGMGASLACGVRDEGSQVVLSATASSDADGWLITLGDMPSISPDTILHVADRLRAGVPLVAPVYHGQRGHPVGFSKEFFGALAELRGDSGARQLVEANSSRLDLLACDDAGILCDIDTPADLAMAGPDRV